MNPQFWSSIGWVVAACVLGFTISAVFAGWMKLARNYFLIPYVLLTSIFLYAFVVLNQIDVAGLLMHNWAWGILASVLASIFLVRTVRAQPASRQSNSAGLAFDIFWAGLVYGLMDALFLSVMPVVAVWMGAAQSGMTATLLGKIGVGIIGLLAGLLITVAYHLGYPEFRGGKVRLAIVGNSIITLAFLLSGNPLGSLISHPAMHIAAVLQGAETTVQLPPHYKTEISQA